MSPDPWALEVDDPLPEGSFRPEALGLLGETLTTRPSEDHRSLPVPDLVADPVPVVADHAAHLGVGDERVAAAAWTNHLATVLVPGLVAAWTLADVGIDASADNVSLHLDGSRPMVCRILDPSRVDRGRLVRDETLASLIDGTLTPVFDAVEQAHDLPAAIAWSHVGNVVAYLFDRLAELGLVPERCPDRERLLAAESLPWGPAGNVLAGTVRYEPLPGAGPDTYQVRTACCLKRQIPEKTPCASCPHIDAERRSRIVADRRSER